MVGNAETIQCLAITNVTLSVDSVEFIWIAPDGSYIVNNSRLTISQINAELNNYTSILQFDYLMEGDEGNYTCDVTTLIFNVSDEGLAEIQSLNSKYVFVCVYICIMAIRYIQQIYDPSLRFTTDKTKCEKFING